jgi:hypothetical protein
MAWSPPERQRRNRLGWIPERLRHLHFHQLCYGTAALPELEFTPVIATTQETDMTNSMVLSAFKRAPSLDRSPADHWAPGRSHFRRNFQNVATGVAMSDFRQFFEAYILA